MTALHSMFAAVVARIDLEARLKNAGEAMLLVEWEGDAVLEICPCCCAGRAAGHGHLEDCKLDNGIYEATGLATQEERDAARERLLGT